MIKSSVEIMAAHIAKDIAHSHDDVQGDFLNSFFENLHCSMKSDSAREKQFCYISDKLSNITMDSIKSLHEFCEIKRNKQ